MMRDLRVGTAELVIDVDVEEVLVVVADTLVILPPETVMETVTDPYWWVTVGPAKVPFLNPLAGAAVVAATAVVPAFVAAAVVPALVAAALAAALEAVLDVWPATDVDADG